MVMNIQQVEILVTQYSTIVGLFVKMLGQKMVNGTEMYFGEFEVCVGVTSVPRVPRCFMYFLPCRICSRIYV